jgi:hypothetical protein
VEGDLTVKEFPGIGTFIGFPQEITGNFSLSSVGYPAYHDGINCSNFPVVGGDIHIDHKKLNQVTQFPEKVNGDLTIIQPLKYLQGLPSQIKGSLTLNIGGMETMEFWKTVINGDCTFTNFANFIVKHNNTRVLDHESKELIQPTMEWIEKEIIKNGWVIKGNFNIEK